MFTPRRFDYRLLAMFVIVPLGLSSFATAANPSLGGVSPVGGQRGTEIEVTLSGGNLGDAEQVLLYDPGISITALRVENGQAIAKFNIAADCPLGIHALRVRTATGVSNLRTFHVGPFVEVKEAEPNSDFAAPQKIEMNVTVNGVVDNEDVDYYLVQAAKGQRISAEVEGIRIGSAFFDPYVAIMDMGRFELSAADDTALVWQDAVASVIAPEDGTYVVQVRESAYGGNGACLYRLHVGTFPRPSAAVPAGGKPGETLNVRLLGDVTGEITQQVVVPAQPPKEFGIEAKDQFGVSPSNVPFRVSNLDNFIEAEPNDAVAQATAGAAPGALNGVIEKAGDIDFFKFTAKQGQVFDVRCFARGIRSPLDPVMVIYNAGGGGIASNDDNGGPDAYIRFSVPADGDYLVSVQDHLNKGGVDYVYRVEAAPVAPQITTSLPEVQQYIATTVEVPQGNRMAVMVAASRADFGGPLDIDLRGLPAGMTMETMQMAADQTTVPVLLTAAPDAATAGALVDVVGKHADANNPFEGRLSQLSWLIRGDNNNLVWGHNADRAALVLTQKVPFKIELVQPNVPIVRDGSMELKVVATRDEGFTGPINVRMLYNPPGIGSVSSINIAEGQTEGLLHLDANNGAPLQSWKIAVIGQAGANGGSVQASSAFVNLQVADSFFDFAFETAAVEQGQGTEVVIKVNHKTPFEGMAQVTLLGLPNEVTTQPKELSKDMAELVFPVTTTKNSPAGRHRSLLCQAIVTVNGEPVLHNLRTGELRIDEPLPPKPNEPPPMVAATPPPMPAEPAPPMEKRLTRLEKLRLEREQGKKSSE